MAIKEIEVKDIMTRTNLPVSYYAANPCAGSTHACKFNMRARLRESMLLPAGAS